MVSSSTDLLTWRSILSIKDFGPLKSTAQVDIATQGYFLQACTCFSCFGNLMWGFYRRRIVIHTGLWQWGGKCHLWVAGWQHFAISRNFSKYFRCFIFVTKEKSPEILVELHLGLCVILENSIFSSTRIIYLIFETRSMK